MKPFASAALAYGVLATISASAQEPLEPMLQRAPSGAIYHAPACAAADIREPLIVYFQGTGLDPEDSQQFLRHVGDHTARCVVGVPYENSRLVASYCVADTTTGAQEPDCIDRVLGAKAAATPSRVDTRSGGVLEVSPERSAEGALLRALQELKLDAYLTADRQGVLWERVILTGASQGAQVALYIALTRHRVAGVGSIVGGVLRTAGPMPYPLWVYRRGKTDPRRIRAYHHENDADAFRREVYAAMGVPEENIRTTAVTGGECGSKPHPCVIIDAYLPAIDGVPVPEVTEDWLWVISSKDH